MHNVKRVAAKSRACQRYLGVFVRDFGIGKSKSAYANDAGGNLNQKAKIPYRRMKAWQIHEYGGVEGLRLSEAVRLPPIRNPNDVLVEVHASSVNPIDVRMLGGYGSQMMNYARLIDSGPTYSMEFPLTLGRDFSGVVKETGRNVKGFHPGDEVWGAMWPHRQGAHAEYCLVPYNSLTKKPVNISHVEAASLPYAGLTAWAAISITGEIREDNANEIRALVLGGSGGVGTSAIQLLKAWGAHVTTTGSTDALPLIISLGADSVIDYKTTNVLKELEGVGKFDIILDTVASRNSQNDDSKFVNLLKSWKNCKYVTVTPPLLGNVDQYGIPIGLMCSLKDITQDVVKGIQNGCSYRWAFFVASSNALNLYAKLVESGKVKAVIDEVYSFEDLPAAYNKVIHGHARGKTVIKFK